MLEKHLSEAPSLIYCVKITFKQPAKPATVEDEFVEIRKLIKKNWSKTPKKTFVKSTYEYHFGITKQIYMDTILRFEGLWRNRYSGKNQLRFCRVEIKVLSLLNLRYENVVSDNGLLLYNKEHRVPTNWVRRAINLVVHQYVRFEIFVNEVIRMF